MAEPGNTGRRPGRRQGQRPRLRQSLSGVSEASSVTVLARHLASTAADPALTDPWASDLVQRLGLDPKQHPPLRRSLLPIVVRARVFDDAVRAFCARVTRAVLVTLGAGLCTRYFRVDAPGAHWFDVDLPNAAACRTELLPEHDDREVVAASVLDPRWMDAVRDQPADGTLFVAEGLLGTLAPEEVRSLILRVADRFPGAELIADSGELSLAGRPSAETSELTRDRPRWAVADFAGVTDWDGRIELIDQSFPLERRARVRSPLQLLRRGTTRRPELVVARLRFAPEPDR